MNKPTFKGHPEDYDNRIIECKTIKHCWKNNHIPFIGYLAGAWIYRGSNDQIYYAFINVLERFVQKKQIVFPDEMSLFREQFKYKHPEFMSLYRIQTKLWTYATYGAAWGYEPYESKKTVIPLFFVRNALFEGIAPKSPKPNNRNKFLFKLAPKYIFKLKGDQKL